MRTRSFDPNQVGARECRAWVAYYRRKWTELLVVSVGLVRAGFGMSWRRTLHGAWLVLRANQIWAARGDTEGARRVMERFYRLLVEEAGERLDTVEAARLEVEWWRLHRERQRGDGGLDPLVEALTELYAFVYGADPAAVRPAATLRAAAMDVSDRWVGAGCVRASPLIAQERALLVRSYAALLAVVHR